MEKFYVADKVKGSTYNNKELLKENGFRWDKTARKWYTESRINGKLALELLDLNIVTEYDMAEEIEAYLDTVDPEAEAMVIEQTGQNGGTEEIAINEAYDEAERVANVRDGEIEIFTHPYPDENFNHGAYLNSRNNHKKPIDGWYKDKLISETPSLGLQFLIGNNIEPGDYVIISIQDYDFEKNGRRIKGTNVCIYAVDEHDVIIEKAKLKIYKKKENKYHGR